MAHREEMCVRKVDSGLNIMCCASANFGQSKFLDNQSYDGS